jgi:peptidoglycan/LPS O-acetylase OafA/YrhL
MTAWDSRKNNFDFLRLSLAILVIYSHAYPLGLGSELGEPFNRLTHGQVTGGAIAVNSFFIMSGFLIAASAQRSSSVWSFLKKRFARIYPAFIVSAILSLLIVVPFASAHLTHPTFLGRLADFVVRTLRLTEFTYDSAFMTNPYPGAINGSTWSIAYEFWCYIAILLVVGLLKKSKVIAVIFVASWIISIAFRLEGWILGGKVLGLILGPPQLWARLLPLYLAGVVFYQLRHRISLNGWFAALSALSLVAASWFYAGWTMAFPFAGTYLIFWFAYSPSIRLHQAGRLGDFSYGTYLYAFPIEQMLMHYFGGHVRPASLFLCATPLTLLCAAASWYGVERHFLQPARRKETVAHTALETISS